jgi:hypothetical protein
MIATSRSIDDDDDDAVILLQPFDVIVGVLPSWR